MSTVRDNLGGCTIALLIPFTTMGRTIAEICLKPVTLDHQLRWQRGEFQNSLALLVALSGETEALLRQIRYPDVERVIGAMMAMLPDGIRVDMAEGVIPQAASAPQAAPAPEQPQPEDPGPDEAFTGLTDA